MPEAGGYDGGMVAGGASGRHVVPLLYAGYLLSFIDRIIFFRACGFIAGGRLNLRAGVELPRRASPPVSRHEA